MASRAKDDLEQMLASTSAQRRRRREADPTEGHELLADSVPDAWGTPLMGELFRFIDYRGKNPKKSVSGKRLIGAKNIKMGYLSEEPVEYISDDTYKAWMTRGFPKKPRLGNLWVTGGSAVRLAEEAVEFAAGRIEGVLLVFRAVVDQWAAVGMNRVAK